MKKIFAIISLFLVPTTVWTDVTPPQTDPALATAVLSAKVNNLEEENRKLSGKVEELQHQLDQFQTSTISAQQPVKIITASPTEPVVLGQSAPAAPAIVTVSADGSAITKPNVYVTKVISVPANSPEKEAMMSDEFDEIFKSVVAEDYKSAKPALKNFIQKYPGTSLAGEAYFWLGEIAWSERDFNTAAINYLKGYQEAPTGDKASENILKMALTLKELGKIPEACKSISRFDTEFPNAHTDLKTKAAAAKTELGCK